MSMIPPRFAPFVLVALGASVTLNAVWLLGGRDEAAAPAPAVDAVADLDAPADPLAVVDADPVQAPAPEVAPATPLAAADPPEPAQAEVPSLVPAPGAPFTAPVIASPTVAAPAAAAPPANPAPPASATVQVARAPIEGSIPQTLAGPAAPLGDAVSAATSRLFMWDMDLRRDLRAGDPLAVAWETSSAGEVTIVGAKLGSGRLGVTLTAYRFQASGDRYPSYWTADGAEVERRLQNTPIRDYEQTTSLLRDRPNHHGMDFKTPTGTEIYSPFDGVVTRTNWNWSNNGNCIEVQLADGTLAKFLHLSANHVAAGDRVRAGQLIALSGNTGHSSGPHLHYQLNRGATVIDPIEFHGTTRRSLPDQDLGAFRTEVARIDALLLPGGWVAQN